MPASIRIIASLYLTISALLMTVVSAGAIDFYGIQIYPTETSPPRHPEFGTSFEQHDKRDRGRSSNGIFLKAIFGWDFEVGRLLK
jgi:hypothetical protein